MVLRLPPRPIPSKVPRDTELFIIGDVHGRRHALSLCLEDIRETPKTADKRIIVFLGDLIDRGRDSLGAIKLAMDAQVLADEVHILPGNHELMMVDAMSGGSQSPWLLNGGITLLDELGVDWRIMSWADVVDVGVAP